MLVAIDAVGIRGDGGARVLNAWLHWLPKVRPEWRWHVFVLAPSLRNFEVPQATPNVIWECVTQGDSGPGRVRWVNHLLQSRLQALGADLVLSFANIGAVRPCKPQVVFLQQMLALNPAGLPAFSMARLRMRVLRWHILRGARSSRAVIVQTAAMQQRLLAYAPPLRDLVHIIPSSCPPHFCPGNLRADKVALVNSATHPRVIYVSLPRKHKNHRTLIEAWPLVLRRHPSAKLLLTADPSDCHNAQLSGTLQRLRQMVVDLKVDGSVVWLGSLNSDEVGFALENSDLHVFPSLSESFGLPLVEAMAAGCPNVVADLPYAHDVTGEAAVFFDCTNPKALAEVLVDTLGNERLLAAMRTKGRERSANFTAEGSAQAIASVLEQALAPAANSGPRGLNVLAKRSD